MSNGSLLSAQNPLYPTQPSRISTDKITVDPPFSHELWPLQQSVSSYRKKFPLLYEMRKVIPSEILTFKEVRSDPEAGAYPWVG